jgi:tight adherence protein C
MRWIDGPDLLIAVLSGIAVAAVARLIIAPTPRLAARVRPYTVASRTSLGRSADVLAIADPGPALSGGTLQRLLGPMVERLARWLGDAVDRTGEEALLLKLRQAGMLREVPEARRVQEYRVRQLTSAALFTVTLGAAPLAIGATPALALLTATLGFVIGVTRWRGRVEQAISERRNRMRIELYTVNQLLAMHARVGGGVVQAMQRVVDRGHGAVVEELADVLRMHRSGQRVVDALEHAAHTTPEPNAARTYKLLANGVEYGADLAEGLRALSEDIRDQRAEAIRRAATKRRAAMLLPIIAVLAPVMLLFIAAPLPSIVLGGR